MNQRLKTVSSACLLGASIMLSGCATIVHGTNENFTVASNPSHAKLYVDGMLAGKTPKQIKLSRKKDHRITIALTGYQPKTIYLRKTFSGWTFGNVVFGGVIGIAVDAFDGAIYNLTPQEMNRYAAQQGFKFNAKRHTIMVILVKHANKKWRKIGYLKSVKS